MEQVTFKGRNYAAKELPVTPMLAAHGLLKQYALEGVRGATGLMQVFSHSRRVVWVSRNRFPRTETEFIAA